MLSQQRMPQRLIEAYSFHMVARLLIKPEHSKQYTHTHTPIYTHTNINTMVHPRIVIENQHKYYIERTHLVNILTDSSNRKDAILQ